MSKASLQKKIKAFLKRQDEKRIVMTGMILTMGILFVVAGLKTVAPNMSFDNEKTYDISSDWTVLRDGIREKVTLPVQVEAKASKVVSFEKVLSYDESLGNSILFRSSQQYIKVYLDQELIYEFGGDQKTIAKVSPGSCWQLLTLPANFSNKTLRIETIAYSDQFAGRFRYFYVGNKSALIYFVLKRALPTIVIMFPILVAGFMLIFASFIFKETYAKRKIRYLGVFSIVISSWIMTESQMLQLISGNLLVAEFVSFSFFSSLPFLACSFLRCYKTFVTDKIMRVIYWITIVTYILVQLLQLTNIQDYMQSYYWTHISMVALIFYVLFVFVKQIRAKEKTEDKDVVLAIAVFGMMAVLDMFRFYLIPSDDNISLTRYGIFLFILILAYFAMKKSVDEQKEMAAQEVYRKMAYIDVLTGLANRNSFEEKVEFYRTNKSATDPIVMIVDLNDLKKINDSYGHYVGDKSIVKLAMTLDKCFGKIGNCYRIGGDEFCVISEKLTEEQFAEKVARFEQEMKAEIKGIPVSISAACGWLKTERQNIDQSIRVVDRLMYENKKKIKEMRRIKRENYWSK